MPKKKTWDIEKAIRIMWPKAKKELEKGIKETRSLIEKGEKQVAGMTETGIQNMKAFSMELRREKLFYELGKLAAKVSPDRWKNNAKISKAIAEIKGINRGISSIRRNR